MNLLREGLDLPEVSLVAILDADKEGFLRSTRALTQTAGRAARNVNGRVILYADRITDSMQRMIDDTKRKREKQANYNIKHNITPTQINRSKDSIMNQTSVADRKNKPEPKAYVESERISIAADPVVQLLNKPELEKMIEANRKAMMKASKDEDFMEAARLRDEIQDLEKMIVLKQT